MESQEQLAAGSIGGLGPLPCEMKPPEALEISFCRGREHAELGKERKGWILILPCALH